MKLMYVVIAMAVMVFSCQRADDKVTMPDITETPGLTDSSYNTISEEQQQTVGNTPQNEKNKQPVNKPAAAQPDWTQKIIKTANVSLELKDYHSYDKTVHQSIAAYGAYIAAEQQQEDDARITNDISIKVPVDQFENLVNYLTADKKNKLLTRQITSADVTAEYADTKSRLETRKQVRDQYSRFMSNANKIDDVLRLQSEINTITENIEAAAGRIKYLNHQASYSTINLHYFQVLDTSKATDEKESGFGSRFIGSLKAGALLVGELFVALASIWPLLLIGGGIWYFMKRKGFFRSAAK